DVVRLVLEIPVALQAEGEAIEGGVAAAVSVVLHDLRVVSAGVVGVVDLTNLYGGRALIEDVRHLRHVAIVLLVDEVPPGGRAGVVVRLGESKPLSIRAVAAIADEEGVPSVEALAGRLILELEVPVADIVELPSLVDVADAVPLLDAPRGI